MAVRLSELAKDLGTTKKELLEKLPALGFELKKTVVDIEESLADQIKDAVRKSGAKFEPPPKKVAPQRPPRPKRPAPAPAATRPAAGGTTPAHAPGPRPEVDVPASASLPGAVAAAPAQPAAPAAVVATTSRPGERSAGQPPPLTLPARAYTSPAALPAPARPAGPMIPSAPLVPRPLPPSAYRSDAPPRPPRTAPPPRTHAPAPPAATAAVATAAGVAPAVAAAADTAPVPQQPRTTPKAPRPASPRPTPGPGRGHGGRRSGGSTFSRTTDSRPSGPSVTEASIGPLKPATLSEGVTVKEFAEKLELKSRDVIKRLMDRGVFATINQSLDKEIAVTLGRDFGFDVKIVSFEEESVLDEVSTEKAEDLVKRPPVVTVMGHVDHGKTSLLDAIRETNVAGREAGQITQHIGAYQVEKRSRKITFLDTPGHEAFTMMRARGAKVTDIVVLVVAADDGVMPQTVEAIHHAKAAQVPIIVAINKIDLPTANPDRVMQMLADNGLLAEAWGGDTVMVKISAKKHLALDELLDLILLVADIQDLKSNPKRAAAGVVLEAKLDKGRGPVATVLVQAGTLRAGDPFIAGAAYGNVRAMFDDRGQKIDEAGPATPIEVLGLKAVPKAGDPLQVVAEDWKARQIGTFRQAQIREVALAKSARLTLDQLYKQIAEGQVRELPIVLKADVQGSVEALTDMLLKLSTDKTKLRILHSGTGAITETDVLLASASNAIIVGFNIRPERKARDLADQEKVDIRLHTIIYNVTNEIKAAIQGMLEPTFHEVTLGRAEVRQLFKVPKVGTIAGSYVTEGRITRDSQVRLLRDNVVVYEGKLASLRHIKEDRSEVRSGYECGIGIANFQDLKEGDVIEAFKMEKVTGAA